jgi:hypothetical protein
VYSTEGFEFCDHVSSFGDEPSGLFVYLKIRKGDQFEIVRATGKTANSFTGVTRGLFGSKDINHKIPDNATSENGITVEEYVYLELPGPAMAYALLTGNIIGGGHIPSSWHLGLDINDINLDAFTNIGEDLFDSTDMTKGLILRFDNVGKTDGKTFIEKEICLLIGAFMPILSDGRLSLKRMTGVLSNADAIVEINPDNIISHSKITYDNSKIYNQISIAWAHLQFPGQKEKFYRTNTLFDLKSISKHGKGNKYNLKFKGLHSSRHTITSLNNRFDALRDRYAGPPMFMSVR